MINCSITIYKYYNHNHTNIYATIIHIDHTYSSSIILQLRESLGGVESTPSWLIVWFGDDKTFIAKFEGNMEIRQALVAGRIKAVLREFIQRRKRMKVAENLALQLAGRLFLGMSLEERRART